MESMETDEGYVPVPSTGVFIVEMGETYEASNTWQNTGHCTCDDGKHTARHWRDTETTESHEIRLYTAQIVETR